MITLSQLFEIERQRLTAAPPVLDTGVAVSALSGTQTVVVNCSGSTEVALVPVDLGVVLGDLVVVGHVNGRPIVLGRLSGAVTPPLPPLGRPTVGVSTFAATDARSYRGGAWRVDSAAIAQADSPSAGGVNTGAWFYGGVPHAELTGATITQARLRLRRMSGGANTSQLADAYPHASDTRPENNVTRLGTDGPASMGLVVGLQGWITLPPTWGQRLVDVGGGFYLGGAAYLQCNGLDTDPQSGLVELTWQR